MSIPSVWFVTGSQHLYGPETLAQVANDSHRMVGVLNGGGRLPAPVVFKSVMTDASAIRKLCREADGDDDCLGIILWMHTFSPAKMWIGGLVNLTKPVCHLHTQFNQKLPWSEIDMDFMNLNQAAHGDREAGHLHTRIGLRRKVIVGHFSTAATQTELASWIRVALAWQDWQGARFVRFGDNMRFVSVTDGDKVSAEAQFGFSVNTHGVGDLVERIQEVSDADCAQLVQEYENLYEVAPELARGGDRRASLIYAARQELGIKAFLAEGDYRGFTTTFEDLHGLDQLPGLACQRLMAAGYGFGAEGDWKTAALLRAFKVMEQGLPGGTSFMEDYTYDMTEGEEAVLGAHMLEVCPSLARDKPRLEIHPLGIGGKSDPVRLVFNGRTGSATNTTLIDLGHRFRFIVNDVVAIESPPMPNLPVARTLWRVEPSFKTGLAAWIYGGGAHHTVFSHNVTSEQVLDFANIAGVEAVVIDRETNLSAFQNELRWNEGAYTGRA